jgi:endonuclease IV
MQRTFSFALGNIWRWNESKNRNALIDYIKDLDVSGVELTFATKEDLYSFKLSKKNKAWLNTLDYVSIHAPFWLFMDAENDEEVLNQLNTITKIYNQINAKNVIIHPEPELLQTNILEKFKIKFSIENLPRKNNVPFSFLKAILRKYPQIDLCLDVSHAYSWSKYETGKLIHFFQKRISQIHFSGSYRKKQHVSLRNVSENFLFSIQPIKHLDVPIVVEEDLKIKSLRYLRQELEYIKSLY